MPQDRMENLYYSRWTSANVTSQQLLCDPHLTLREDLLLTRKGGGHTIHSVSVNTVTWSPIQGYVPTADKGQL